MINPSSGSQQYKPEVCHFKEVHEEFFAISGAEIMVYQWWLARAGLCVDRDDMGMAWVLRDFL